MRWNLSSSERKRSLISPKNFSEEDRRTFVNFVGQISDREILFARVWNRDSCNRRLVPLSADPNRTNPLPSLTRTGRNHCEQSSYSQRSPGSCLFSFYCRRFGCVATRVSVLETVDGHIRRRFFGKSSANRTDGKSFERRTMISWKIKLGDR